MYPYEVENLSVGLLHVKRAVDPRFTAPSALKPVDISDPIILACGLGGSSRARTKTSILSCFVVRRLADPERSAREHVLT